MTPRLPSTPVPWVDPESAVADAALQLLHGQEDRLRLPGPQRDPGLQDPRHLGQGHPAARYSWSRRMTSRESANTAPRQLWRRPRQVLVSSSGKVFRCFGSCHAVPLVDINREPGMELVARAVLIWLHGLRQG